MNHVNQMEALRLIAYNKTSEVEKLLDTIDELRAKIYGIPKEQIKTLVDSVKALSYPDESPVANTVDYWLERL